MDCFLDAKFRTTGIDNQATNPTRNQLAAERAIDDRPKVDVAATLLRVVSENIHDSVL